MRRCVSLALVAVLMVACGSDDDESVDCRSLEEPITAADAPREGDEGVQHDCGSSEEPITAAEAPPLEEAVRSYTNALVEGDVEAAQTLVSGRCRRHGLPLDEFEAMVERTAELHGGARITSYSDSIDGPFDARATYELTEPALNRVDEPWLLEEGAWRLNDC